MRAPEGAAELAVMNIVMFGAGRIGIMLAFQFNRGGHRVTVIARGLRRDALLIDRAIVMTSRARLRLWSVKRRMRCGRAIS